MKKNVFKTLSFIALTLAGAMIGYVIAFESTGKELVFGLMGITSTFISAWLLYIRSKKEN